MGDLESGSEVLRDSAREALNYLEIREQFWRQQNPMYARKVGLNFNNDVSLTICGSLYFWQHGMNNFKKPKTII